MAFVRSCKMPGRKEEDELPTGALGVRFENRMDNAGAAIVECKDGSRRAAWAGT